MAKKMSSRILLAFFIINIVNVVFIGARDCAPVILWGIQPSPSDTVSPFLVMSATQFEDFLNENIESSTPILVFYKNNLCVEDLTQHKEALQDLKQVGLNYIPQVESPYEVLNNLLSHNVTNVDSVDYILNNQIVMTEVENLDGIVNTYKAVKNSSPNVIGILTGKGCKFTMNERNKREADYSNSTNFIAIKNNFLMYSKNGISIKTNGNGWQKLPSDPNTVTISGNGNVTSPYNINIIFKNVSGVDIGNDGKLTVTMTIVSEYTDYWTLKSLSLNEETLNASDSDVVFPTDFSYRCSKDIVFADSYKNPKISVNISNLQMEIVAMGENVTKFGDPYDCVGFVTIPILTGLLVTFLFIIFVAWGLHMIMDIKTMDRFDDPKSKGITNYGTE